MTRIKKGDDIERRADITESERTNARDITADYIEEMWPADLQDIGEATAEHPDAPDDGWSRQHVRNTLDIYFVPVSDPEESAVSAAMSTKRSESIERRSADLVDLGVRSIELDDGLEVEVPADVENLTDFLRGARAGADAARSSE